MNPVRVGIGLIVSDGRYLIRRRPPLPGSPMPGLWEFPGGKCEAGELPEDAVVRECREETGLAVAVLGLRQSRVYHYPHGLVELNYFDCVPESPEAAPDGGFVWVAPRDLLELEFPPANAPILRDLAGLPRPDDG